MSNHQKYVLGFMFHESRPSVVLIRKEKPDWQKGLLNGIGGKIEPGESKADAMAREFLEETGVPTEPMDWREFCEMSGDGFAVYCFVAFDSEAYTGAVTMESEQIVKCLIDEVEALRCVSNIPWLLQLALDLNYGKPPYATVRYAEPYTFQIP